MITGIGYPIKIPDLHNLHLKRIRASQTGSTVFTNSKIVRLIQEQPGVAGSRVTGAIISRRLVASGKDELIKVEAQAVVLATGGFQGSSELTSRHLGPGADNVFVRSNVGSVGDGLTLALTAGAGTSRGMSTYYGHLLAAPLRREDVDPKDFLPLAQYQSRHCLLINEAGKRFADETLGDEVVNQYLAKQPSRRGFILFDEETRQKHCLSALFPNAGNVDRLEKARSHGCNVESASTIAGLTKILTRWGVDGQQAARTIDSYRGAVRDKDESIMLDAPVGRAGDPPRPLVDSEGPFFAMEVQPS